MGQKNRRSKRRGSRRLSRKEGALSDWQRIQEEERSLFEGTWSFGVDTIR